MSAEVGFGEGVGSESLAQDYLKEGVVGKEELGLGGGRDLLQDHDTLS